MGELLDKLILFLCCVLLLPLQAYIYIELFIRN